MAFSVLTVIVVYCLCGLFTAVLVERRSTVDNSDLAWLPFIAWPAFLLAIVVEVVVRRLAGKRVR